MMSVRKKRAPGSFFDEMKRPQAEIGLGRLGQRNSMSMAVVVGYDTVLRVVVWRPTRVPCVVYEFTE
jgi:hypothetical protein